MGRRLRMTILAAGIGAALGCAARLPAGVQLTPGFASPGTPYGDALRRHTRYAELYNGVDTVAKGWATERTSELRAALAEASIRAYQLQGEAAETMRQEARAASLASRDFHLALYTPKKQWNDLESADSLWRARLERPGGESETPIEVKALAKSDKSPVEYPYVSPWTREYELRFPSLDDAMGSAPASLVLTGPLGTVRFQF
ncbi:MAG: hypothetical protein HZB55_17040 [Deltaproteobacteria bacterium]|nr:hypothetical protein [Deltaproteobacteria bacterium]